MRGTQIGKENLQEGKLILSKEGRTTIVRFFLKFNFSFGIGDIAQKIGGLNIKHGGMKQ